MKFNHKVYCIHCEMVTMFYGIEHKEIPNNYRCCNCGAGWMDVQSVRTRNGFFKQAYPSLKYDDIKTDYFYPLYPDFRG